MAICISLSVVRICAVLYHLYIIVYSMYLFMYFFMGDIIEYSMYLYGHVFLHGRYCKRNHNLQIIVLVCICTHVFLQGRYCKRNQLVWNLHKRQAAQSLGRDLI